MKQTPIFLSTLSLTLSALVSPVALGAFDISLREKGPCGSGACTENCVYELDLNGADKTAKMVVKTQYTKASDGRVEAKAVVQVPGYYSVEEAVIFAAGSSSISESYVNRRSIGEDEGGAGNSEDRWGTIVFKGNLGEAHVIRADKAEDFDKAAAKSPSRASDLMKQKVFFTKQSATPIGSVPWVADFRASSPDRRPDYDVERKEANTVSPLYFSFLALRFAPAANEKVPLFTLAKNENQGYGEFSAKPTGTAIAWNGKFDVGQGGMTISPTVNTASRQLERLDFKISAVFRSLEGKLARQSCSKN